MYTRYPIALHTSTSGTDVDEYYPSGTTSGVSIDTKGATSVTLITHREVDTGVATFQAFVEFYVENAGTTGGLWYPLLDLSNATQVQGVVYANDAWDTTTPFHRFLTLRDHNRLTTAADNVVAINTVHKYYNIWMPELIRFRFRHGGTTVTNQWSGIVLVHRQSA